MRKLMWFAIGFAAGCGICAYLLPVDWVLPAAAAVLVVQSAALIAMHRWKPVRVCAMTCFGCAAALLWFGLFHSLYLSSAAALDGIRCEATLIATDYSYETDYGTGVSAVARIDGKLYRTNLYLNEAQQIQPGDVVSGDFYFGMTTSDSVHGATSDQGKGKFLVASQRADVLIQTAEELPVWAFSAKLRMLIKERLRISLPEDVSAFSKALLLGDTSDLSYETDTDFKISGIRHVVAVSGLHISILFSLVNFATFRKRWLTALVGIPVLFLFASVAGFTPSVVRACVMSGLMLLGSLLEKEYDGPTALSFAVLVILIFNPLAVTSVSLQLSAASVAGIQLFQEPIRNWLLERFGKPKKRNWKKLVNWFCGSVSVSISAMLLTTPLCAWYFGMVSLVSILTNLLVLWAVSFIFYGLMAVCVLALFWQGGAVLLGRGIAWLIRYVLTVAGVMADLPLAAVYTKNIYIVFWLIFVYILLAVFLLQRKKRPVVLISCAVLGLCLSLLAGWQEPREDNCRLTVLDVGQGQSILLQTQGRTFLIDCGGDRDSETADLIAATLFGQGIDHLDGIVLTHYDADHAGGLEYLLTRIQTDLLLVPDTVDAVAYPQVEGTVIYVLEDVQLTLNQSTITVFGPVFSGSSNENSLCVLFESENCDILITGDRSDFGERMLMRHTTLPDVDVLIAGHHGAKDSTSEELLRAVTPETVIISVGDGNLYGHPHSELLQRLSEFGCEVYRTDLNGTIIYRR